MNRPSIYQHPELDGSAFFWPKSKIAVLCLHGFTATTVDVRGMAHFLCENGYSVCGPLLPGHATTPEDLNQKRWKDWFLVAEKAYLDLKQTHDQVFVLGESLGGLLSLHLAAKYPEIPGIILLAPALIINKLWLVKLLSPFKEYIFKPYVLKKGSVDTMLWQGYNVIPLKAGSSLFDFQQLVKKELKSVTAPVIIFQGRKDTTIDPMSSVYVIENINSSRKELIWLPDSGHVILLDNQASDVEKASLEFIQDNLVRT